MCRSSRFRWAWGLAAEALGSISRWSRRSSPRFTCFGIWAGSRSLLPRQSRRERGVLGRPVFALSVKLADLDGESFIVRTRCDFYQDVTNVLVARGIRMRVVYQTDHDDRALALV